MTEANTINPDVMLQPTAGPRHVDEIKGMATQYLSNFANSILLLKEADTNTWQALAADFLLAMNNAGRLASECYYAKEWYTARGETLKDALKKREGVLYTAGSLDKLAASARAAQLKILCQQDGDYMGIRALIHSNSQVIAEFASYEMHFKSLVAQADNGHVTSRMAGKRDADVMHKM